MPTVFQGAAAVGIRGIDSVVLAVEKRTTAKLQVILSKSVIPTARTWMNALPQNPFVHSLCYHSQDPRTIRKMAQLDVDIALAFAGLNADARILVDKARMECQSYRLTVEDAPTCEYIASYIAKVQQQYTQRGGRRPFGIATLIGGFSHTGAPQLWQTDPSGSYSSWKVCIF